MESAWLFNGYTVSLQASKKLSKKLNKIPTIKDVISLIMINLGMTWGRFDKELRTF